MMSGRRLVLGSRSSRRAALLRSAGYRFRLTAPLFDDPPHPEAGPDESPEETATRIARAKAVGLLNRLSPDEVLLTADTLCTDGGSRLVGTPESMHEARDMIHHWIGRSHDVVTGVAVWAAAERDAYLLVDRATVTWGRVPEPAINRYLDSLAWRDKAGGYNLGERQAAGWPLSVVGDPTAVVGLPMRRLSTLLDEIGVLPAETVAR